MHWRVGQPGVRRPEQKAIHIGKKRSVRPSWGQTDDRAKIRRKMLLDNRSALWKDYTWSNRVGVKPPVAIHSSANREVAYAVLAYKLRVIQIAAIEHQW